jgi:hypothetical protein
MKHYRVPLDKQANSFYHTNAIIKSKNVDPDEYVFSDVQRAATTLRRRYKRRCRMDRGVARANTARLVVCAGVATVNRAEGVARLHLRISEAI